MRARLLPPRRVDQRNRRRAHGGETLQRRHGRRAFLGFGLAGHMIPGPKRRGEQSRGRPGAGAAGEIRRITDASLALGAAADVRDRERERGREDKCGDDGGRTLHELEVEPVERDLPGDLERHAEHDTRGDAREATGSLADERR